VKSGGNGGSLSGSGYFRGVVKSGGRGASSTELFETLEEAEVSPGPYTALLVGSGGRGASGTDVTGVISGSGVLDRFGGGLAIAVFSEGVEEELGSLFSIGAFPKIEKGDLAGGAEPNGCEVCA
jgi:hypothetical protein